ncbi:MAG: HlyD family secretion protein [Bacteroidales bacterium]|nr:HlyD family secretion protein [Bacteroidales bacterium]
MDEYGEKNTGISPKCRDQERDMTTRPLELQSPLVQEIFGRPPRWIVRWGIAIVCGAVMALVAGSAYFKYPDKVVLNSVVETGNMPICLNARESGWIDTSFVANGDTVEAGSVLFVQGSPIRYVDVETARIYVATYGRFCRMETDSLPTSSYPKDLELGTLQPIYDAFVKAVEDYISFDTDDCYTKIIAAVGKQEVIQNQVLEQMKAQVGFSENQLQEKLFITDSALYAGKIISLAEYGNHHDAIMQLRKSHAKLLISENYTRLEVAQLEQKRWRIKKEEWGRRQVLFRALTDAYWEFLSRVDTWRQNYMYISPVSGVVETTEYWRVNQRVTAGMVLLRIRTEGERQMVGRIRLPSQVLGNVMLGQDIYIKFDAYPYMEYGKVKAKVDRILLLPEQDGDKICTVAEFDLPDCLETNYGKHLEVLPEMSGIAEILSVNRSLLERILNPLKAHWRH